MCLMILSLLNWSIDDADKLWNISLNIESISASNLFEEKIENEIIERGSIKNRLNISLYI